MLLVNMIVMQIRYHAYIPGINGKFSPEQKRYTMLFWMRKLQRLMLYLGQSYKEPHNVAVKIMVQGLLDLGIMQGNLDEIIESERYRQFYMHGTGHWLGLDVHDVGDYKIDEEWRNYEVGMVVTVEPGLYIAPDDENVESRWRGIGIRIEDDVLRIEYGPRV